MSLPNLPETWRGKSLRGQLQWHEPVLQSEICSWVLQTRKRLRSSLSTRRLEVRVLARLQSLRIYNPHAHESSIWIEELVCSSFLKMLDNARCRSSLQETCQVIRTQTCMICGILVFWKTTFWWTLECGRLWNTAWMKTKIHTFRATKDYDVQKLGCPLPKFTLTVFGGPLNLSRLTLSGELDCCQILHNSGKNLKQVQSFRPTRLCDAEKPQNFKSLVSINS